VCNESGAHSQTLDEDTRILITFNEGQNFQFSFAPRVTEVDGEEGAMEERIGEQVEGVRGMGVGRG
jgi:hypothetical protein